MKVNLKQDWDNERKGKERKTERKAEVIGSELLLLLCHSIYESSIYESPSWLDENGFPG